MASFDLWIAVWILEVVVCCTLAAWKGGPTERIGAAIILVGWILSAVLQSHSVRGPGAWVVVVDIAALIALAILSERSRRLWTLFAVACQLNAVGAHFAVLFNKFGIFSYLTDLGLWSGDGLIVFVIIGVVDHVRRQKRLMRMFDAGVPLPPRLRRSVTPVPAKPVRE